MLRSIMDPATLALTAAALIAKKALEAAGDQAGKTGWQALGRIAHTIRGWFAGDQAACMLTWRDGGGRSNPAAIAVRCRRCSERQRRGQPLVSEWFVSAGRYSHTVAGADRCPLCEDAPTKS
jgi:hypothetical protein